MIIKVRRGLTNKNREILEKAGGKFFEGDNGIVAIRDNFEKIGDMFDKSVLKELRGGYDELDEKGNVGMTSKMFKDKTIVNVKGVEIGNGSPIIIAGPCAIEPTEDNFMNSIAKAVKEQGANILRGGAFKPRTSPYSFRGMEEEGLKLLKKAGEIFNIPTITEAMNEEGLSMVEEYADIIQIGARNMSNFSLLKAAGKSNKPVVLKRGMSANIEEFLLAAEHIMYAGNSNVILCERGIRTFANGALDPRNTLDMSTVPILKEETHLPIIIDPSHACGKREYIKAVSRSAIVSGADGLMIETHNNPEEAMCDGRQSIEPKDLGGIVNDSKLFSEMVRSLDELDM